MILALQVELDINAEQDEMKCRFEIVQAESPNVGLWSVVPPTYPARLCFVIVEFITEDMGHILFGGNTKPFRDGFVDAKIPGGHVKTTQARSSSDVAYSDYLRMWKDLNLNDESVVVTLGNIITNVLKSSPVVIKRKKTAFSGTEFIVRLKAKFKSWKNVRFDIL